MMRRHLTMLLAFALAACGQGAPDPDAQTLNMADNVEVPDALYQAETGRNQSDEANAADEDEDEDEPKVAIQRWSKPNLDEVRYVQVTDQTGCRWWTPLVASQDDDAPHPVIGANHRPACTDRSQEPDAEVEMLPASKAEKLIAKGDAVRADKAAIERQRKRDAGEDGDDDDAGPEKVLESDDGTPEPTPTPTATPAHATGGLLMTTRGRPAIAIGDNLAMTHDGRMAIRVGGTAIPLHR